MSQRHLKSEVARKEEGRWPAADSEQMQLGRLDVRCTYIAQDILECNAHRYFYAKFWEVDLVGAQEGWPSLVCMLPVQRVRTPILNCNEAR